MADDEGLTVVRCPLCGRFWYVEDGEDLDLAGKVCASHPDVRPEFEVLPVMSTPPE